MGAVAGRLDRGRRVLPGRNPGLITESPWISRVSRIVICLPSALACSLVCSKILAHLFDL